jgi:hypothetical protein
MATLREMESVALSMGNDIGLSNDLGNVIDITDNSDALGLNMLANQAKISFGGPPPSSTPSQTVNFSNSAPALGGIEISSLEPLQPITLNMDSTIGGFNEAPPMEIKFSKEPAPPSFFSNQQTATGPSISLTPVQQNRNPEQEKKDKIEYLNKLQRLEQKGFPVARKFTMDNSLDEIKSEYDRLVDARNLEGSLRFQRQALMGVVTGLEWMNNRFDPFDLNLDGWSESVHENVEDFDEIFEELYDKYKDRGKMPPEARLMFALAGSGFMCHVSNTFMRQRMPSADDLLRKNPELARQFAQAAAAQAGSGFGNFMGMAMGAASGGPVAAPVTQGPAGPQGMDPMSPTGAFFASSQAFSQPPFAGSTQPASQMPNTPQVMASVEPSRQTARKEMKGPSGVDDILKTFEEVRRTEAMGGMDNGMGGIAPPGMSTMVPPAMNQPAVTAAMEMESVVSGDFASQAESTRTGGGRRRRKAAISGNTLSLNV